jgi:phosphoribosylformylglycinamidine cyclo-ligase
MGVALPEQPFMSLYQQRGVSAQKEEVHAAIGNLDQGLFPYAFCKLYPDHLGGDPNWVNITHADGAGTKSILAYMYWKETGDLSVWRGIAQDAVVMNLDDLLCTGIYDRILFSSTIDRNKRLIPVEILKEIIDGTQAIFDELKKSGIHIHYLGGETADVGDVVRTIAVNGTMTARWPKSKLVTNDRIQPGDVIVGLASFGETVYEQAYNSGIGSNGLTSARHDMLQKHYGNAYPESCDPGLDPAVTYIGPHRLQDMPEGLPEGVNVGKLLLSPTRTFAPVMKEILERHFDDVHGLIHCSGGGQTKCLKYLPGNMRIVKDDFFDIPPVFRMIQQASGSDDREMFQVFNMGCRMEIYTRPEAAAHMLTIARHWGVEAKIIGRVVEGVHKSLQIHVDGEVLDYAG